MVDGESRTDSILVKKRNGNAESFNIDKIHKIVELACEDLSGVSVSDIEMKAHLSFHDSITTTEIHRAITKAAADLISESSPNYQYVAGRLLNYDIRKSAWGGASPPRLYDHVVRMVDAGYYTNDLLNFYNEKEWNKLNSFIDHNRDLDMEYIAVMEYVSKYAVRDRSLSEMFPLETPQLTYILISAILMYDDFIADNRNLNCVKNYYNHISTKQFTQPTPIMAGIRTPTKQGSSCVLISVDDTLNSICAASSAIVKYISKKAGIGLDVSRIRAEGSSVGKEKGVKHTGVIPYLKLFEAAVKSCSQGGVRGGSCTTHFQLWHYEIEDLLVLKNNKGTADNRVRKMDYSIQINNYLYNRFIQNKDITLFSPHDVKDMYDAFFGDQNKFAELYEKYEADPTIRKKTINARELFTKLMIERKETGRIYIFNVDNVNNHSTFNVPITQSNLCLSGDTRISTDKGLLTLKELYDTQATFNVASDNRAFEHNEILFKRIKGSIHPIVINNFGTSQCESSNVFLTNNYAEVYNLQLNNGSSIKATLDHKFMTDSGMKPLRDIKNGDNIYTQSGVGLFSNNYNLPTFNMDSDSLLWKGRYLKNKFIPPTTWTKEIGEMLGWIIGDGFIYYTSDTHKMSVMVFGKYDDGLIEYFKPIIENMFDTQKVTFQIFEDSSTQMKIFSTRFTSWLEMLGVTNKKAHEKIIPHAIWTAPKEAQIGFLRGLFTSDGTVDISTNCQAVTVSLTSTSLKLLEETQLLLNNLGIKSSIYNGMKAGLRLLPDSNRNPKLYNCQKSYCLKIGKSNRNEFIKTIGFMLERKNLKVTETMTSLAQRDFISTPRNGTYQETFMAKVDNITFSGIEEVYDITVNDSHSFIANGMVVHNCQEITLPTNPLQDVNDTSGEIALCTLSSINLGVIKNLDDLEQVCRSAVRGLDNLLSYQEYMVPAAKTSTKLYRTLGIGITNMAYYLAKHGYKYADPEAHQLLHYTMEAISYYCIKASVELAKERGACVGLKNTKFGDGLLPIDHYNKNVDEIVKPVYKLDWESLRKDLKQYGIRNATLLAVAPVETSSKILNSTNGVEPVRSLITTKSNKSNSTRQVVPEFSKLKNKYDLLWDMKDNDGIIKCMAVIQKFVCQSISTNMNYNPAHYTNGEIPMSILMKDTLTCNKYGLKTIYYLNTNDQRDVELVEEIKVDTTKEMPHNDESVCDSCAI